MTKAFVLVGQENKYPFQWWIILVKCIYQENKSNDNKFHDNKFHDNKFHVTIV
jgi:hypothetical protein